MIDDRNEEPGVKFKDTLTNLDSTFHWEKNGENIGKVNQAWCVGNQ